MISWGPLLLFNFVQKYRLAASVPNIVVMLRIVASCERSFKRLKLIKNHLRSNMTNSRFNGLAILSIEHKFTEQMDFTDLIQEFSENGVRRASYRK